MKNSIKTKKELKLFLRQLIFLERIEKRMQEVKKRNQATVIKEDALRWDGVVKEWEV
jgi:hypothetical protein